MVLLTTEQIDPMPLDTADCWRKNCAESLSSSCTGDQAFSYKNPSRVLHKELSSHGTLLFLCLFVSFVAQCFTQNQRYTGRVEFALQIVSFHHVNPAQAARFISCRLWCPVTDSKLWHYYTLYGTMPASSKLLSLVQRVTRKISTLLWLAYYWEAIKSRLLCDMNTKLKVIK